VLTTYTPHSTPITVPNAVAPVNQQRHHGNGLGHGLPHRHSVIGHVDRTN
jgi:hypothetical protein